MAAFKAFQSNHSNLVRLVSDSVKSVADECLAASIIGSDTYEKVMQASSIKKDKARHLLMEITSRIEVQAKQGECDPEKCVFAKFVQILKKEPSLESIALKLEETLADIERTSPNVEVVDSGVVRDQSVSVFGDRSASGFSREDSTSADESRPLSQPDASLNAPTAESSEGAQSRAPVLFAGGIGSGVSDLMVQISDMEAVNAEKEVKIKELEDKLETTTHEKNEFEHKLKEAEDEIEALSLEKNTQIAALRNHITALREKAASKEQEKEKMTEKFQADIRTLENELKENKTLYDKSMLKLTNERCDLIVKVKNFEIEEQKLKKEIEMAKRETAEAQRETANVEKKRLEEQVAILTKRLAEMDNK